MKLSGIILFDMNIFCLIFRFSWSKLRDLYPALCKLLSKSKSVIKLSLTQGVFQTVKFSHELYGQVAEFLLA